MPFASTLLLTAVVFAGLPEVSISWSPDARWSAYVLATRSAELSLPDAWLFATDPGPTPASRADEPPDLTYRLWATRAETAESTLLAESKQPLTAPCWKPDGSAVAYGRLVAATAGGTPRFEVVVQDTPDHAEALTAWDLAGDLGQLNTRIGGARVAWSPDGRYLAVPGIAPTGIRLLRADGGHLLKTLDGAFSPSWSPDGSHLAFYRADGLYWLDANFGEAKRLVVVPNADLLPAPVWTRDGQALLVVLRGAVFRWRGRFGGGFGGRFNGMNDDQDRLDLVRVWLDQARLEPVRSLVNEPFTDPNGLQSASFAQDPDGVQIFYTIVAQGRKTQVSWYITRDNAVRSTFHPVDESVPIGALALPGNASGVVPLAFRAGGDGGLNAVVGLCDPVTQKVTPFVPDDAARLEWIALLADTARALLAEHPALTADGMAIERATILPGPAELQANGQNLPRIQHLARVGRPLCDRPANVPPATPQVQARLDQARLFFDYLLLDEERPRESYRAALADLEAVEASATNPDQRLRLLCLRAQIDLGLGERDRARSTLEYVREAIRHDATELEPTATGYRHIGKPRPLTAWLGMLRADTASTRTPGAANANATDPLGNVNFDAPKPGLGLDALPELQPLRNDRIDEIRIIPSPRRP